MIPGNQPDVAGRFKGLTDAVKFVFASTFFQEARAYRRAAGELPEPEKMARRRAGGRRPQARRALLPRHLRRGALLELLPRGARRAARGCRGPRRSASARRSWTGAPAGRSPPPTPSCRLRWDRCASSSGPRSRDSGRSTSARRRRTTRWRRRSSSSSADSPTPRRTGRSATRPRPTTPGPTGSYPASGASDRASSTSPRSWSGTSCRWCRRLRRLLAVCEEELAAPVEIEFALSIPPGRPARLGFLQVRPLVVSGEAVEVEEDELGRRRRSWPRRLRSATAGTRYGTSSTSSPGASSRASRHRSPARSRPSTAPARCRPPVPADRLRTLGLDRSLARHPGALGPDLGSARDRGGDAAPDEPRAEPGLALLPQPLELLGPLLHGAAPGHARAIDWDWLASQELVARTDHVRHVRTRAALVLRVDGRSRRGVARR